MKSQKNTWTRRAVLEGLGLGLLAPFVPLLGGDAEAQGMLGNKRLLVFFHPNGFGKEKAYFPTGTEKDFNLSEILEPLSDHKNDLVIFKGLRNQAALDTGRHGHISFMGTLLSGEFIDRSSSAPFKLGKYRYGWSKGTSVDQFIAQKIATGTAPPVYSSLNYHVIGQRDTSATQTRMSYSAPGTVVTPEADPREALARLVGSSSSAGGEELAKRLGSERTSALDFLMGDLKRVKQRVGAEDQKRLDGHLSAFRELESRVGGGAGALSCKSVSLPGFNALNGSESYRPRGKAFMDTIVQSFQCDATRVAGLQWSNAGLAGPVTMTWLGHNEHEHKLSHASNQAYTETKVFYMQQLDYLIKKLKDTPDAGGGSLFDNTLILVCSEHGEGSKHGHKNMPFMFAGNAGGAFKTGRYLTYDNLTHNSLLVSTCHAMGISNVDSFGNPKYPKGPLPGLV